MKYTDDDRILCHSPLVTLAGEGLSSGSEGRPEWGWGRWRHAPQPLCVVEEVLRRSASLSSPFTQVWVAQEFRLQSATSVRPATKM